MSNTVTITFKINEKEITKKDIEIGTQVSNVLEHFNIELKEATLYTSFRRLEESKLISSYWGDENSGARRRYYSITELGKKAFAENRDDWEKIQKMVTRLISRLELPESQG